jgi:hypothetical protein
MAFTTSTVTRVEQGNKQLQGAFSEMWFVTATVDPASVAAGAEDTGTLTVPGVALGDMVIGYAAGVNQTIDADLNVFVSAANTVTIRLSNLNGAAALDLASSTWKIMVARPIW